MRLSCRLPVALPRRSPANRRSVLFVPAFGSASFAKEPNKPSPEKEQHMKKNEKTEQKTNAAPHWTNRVTLVGFIADKADQYDGFAILRLATKVSWKDKTSGEWQSHTDWHRVIAWNGLADAVKDFGKGDHVMVEGELRSSEYDREVQVVGAGKAVISTKTWEIRARAIRKLDRKPKADIPPKAVKKKAA